MRQHVLSSGNKRLAEARPLDPVSGIGLRPDDPEASDPRQWRGAFFSGTALSAVRDAIRTSEVEMAYPASSHQSPTSSDEIRETSPALPHPLAPARACQGPPSEFTTSLSDAPADHSPKILAVASVEPLARALRTRPQPRRGTITLDAASFTTKIGAYRALSRRHAAPGGPNPS